MNHIIFHFFCYISFSFYYFLTYLPISLLYRLINVYLKVPMQMYCFPFFHKELCSRTYIIIFIFHLYKNHILLLLLFYLLIFGFIYMSVQLQLTSLYGLRMISKFKTFLFNLHLIIKINLMEHSLFFYNY